ncbi:uncharacterized protein LOC131009916 [Salvia miltiorrhiza]|uniref:uncharacterized protein LOC131009916 n=1 Tax=Salvia miltiorrhiza TaxID=226208 RepID=UPI0025ABBA11|nr:uncharacterized protein LOC131009916 [Salvia miltiorrhiza]
MVGSSRQWVDFITSLAVTPLPLPAAAAPAATSPQPQPRPRPSPSPSRDLAQSARLSLSFSPLSPSKLCRGDAISAQIDASALKSVSNLSENVGVKGNKPVQQQQQMREMEEGSEVAMEVESLKKMVTAARQLDSAMFELILIG